MEKKLLDKVLQSGIFIGLFVVTAVPLVMNSSFFFPFIYPKALVFRMAVELMLLLYLLLAYRMPHFRFFPSYVLYGVLAFLGINFISSILGVNFYQSFWGDIERSEGLVTHLHLVALFFIIIGLLKSKEDWKLLFDLFLFISIPVSGLAIGQAFGYDRISNVAGSRVTSTIGNAAFLAGYALFNIGFAIWLGLTRQNKYLKIYYALAVLINFIVMYLTGTRGAILGMGAGVLTGLFFAIRFSASKLLRVFLLVVIIFAISGYSFLRINKDADFIARYEPIKRISEISLTTRTAQTRFWTWGSAWQGWQDKFWLGYGLDHFNIAFDKYFNPLIYQDEGSIVWFDRAHNIIFDRAVTSGVIGLIIYLALLFYPVWWFYKSLVNRRIDFILATVFSVIIIAYFVQNLFVFDTIVTYIPWIFVLGFIHYLVSSEKEYNESKLISKKIYGVSFLAMLVVFIPVMYMVNYKPTKANLIAVDALLANSKGEAVPAYDAFTESLDYDTYGNQEYRIQLIEFVQKVNASLGGEVNEFMIKATTRTDEEITKQLAERPKGRNFVLALRYYIATQNISPDRLQKAIDFKNEAIMASPTRPQIYYELGSAHLKLAQIFANNDNKELFQEHYDEAKINFQTAIDLNPAVEESYLKMITLFMAFNQGNEIIFDYLKMMDEKGLNYKEIRYLEPLALTAFSLTNYDWALYFYQELIKIDDTNPNYSIRSSLALAYLGRDKEAIAEAQNIAIRVPSLTRDAELFIEQVKNGFYKTN